MQPFLQGALVPFSGKIVLESKTWVVGMLIAEGCWSHAFLWAELVIRTCIRATHLFLQPSVYNESVSSHGHLPFQPKDAFPASS